MDTLSAFARSMAAEGQPLKIFDWNKAATIIKERKPLSAVAGLDEDMGYTAGDIYRNGKPVKEYTFLASNWATPILVLEFFDGEETIDCFIMEDTTEWDGKTSWPKSAKKILTET